MPGQASLDRMGTGGQQWQPGMPAPSMGGAEGGGVGPSAAAAPRGQPGSGPSSPGHVREVGGLVREHVEFV